MRNVHIVAYDIADPARLRQVHKTVCGFGDPLQLSVYRCELSKVELLTLKEKLWPILKLDEDRVMIVDLGPADGRGDECIEYWGAPRGMPRSRGSLIV